MSGSFYARYVPPVKLSSNPSEVNSTNGQKRKHEPLKQEEVKRKKHKAQTPSIKVQAPGISPSKPIADEPESFTSQQPAVSPSTDILAKYSVTRHAQSHGTSQNGITRKKSRKNERKIEGKEEQEPNIPDAEMTENQTALQDNRASEDESDDNEDATDSKHSSVMSKFQRSRVAASKVPKTPEEDPQIEELHGLEPIPQPPPALTTTTKPTYSTLPPWLANPTRVSPSDRQSFNNLQLDTTILQNLKAKNMNEAFSVQSAVLPLLIDGPERYNGDLCISAATGSGKTLAYVLPMVQSLMNYATTRLRGLIVVPTRELVKQAREVCEVCAAGTGLQIATAVGNKSLKEEEALLVEEYQEFRPQKQVEQPMTLQNWEDLDLQDLINKSKQKIRPGFVHSRRSKIDVLICTPGRLVEHLRSTDGFSLDHLEWLIIDEADRLMNESFQEWLEVVIPALEHRNPDDQKLTNMILQQMKMPRPVQILQKVILSATFSLDISKLNSLKLRNPKLIVVGNETVETNAAGMLSLPSTLSEFAIPVGDGSAKPLYLLELMRTKLLRRMNDPAPISENPSMTDSDEDTSSDDDSSTSSDDEGGTTAKCLIFAGSTESAERLYRLLGLLDPSLVDKVSTLTKISASSSQRVLSLLRQGKISFVIATDRASRGLDIPELDHVISYDVPNSVTSYVHRVGRTARAGLSGQAWTLIAHREARWFWNEIGKGKGEMMISRKQTIQKVNLEMPQSEEMKNNYENALKALGEQVLQKRSTRSKDTVGNGAD